jgi:hypothetical protein
MSFSKKEPFNQGNFSVINPLRLKKKPAKPNKNVIFYCQDHMFYAMDKQN